MPIQKSLFALLIGAVTLIVGMSLYTTGSPMRARAERFDNQRVNDLEQIRNALDQYWTATSNLPLSLEDLERQRDQYYITSIKDPRTGSVYEFTPVTGSGGYELCASFETNTEAPASPSRKPYPESFWQHGIGRQCFPLQIRTLKPLTM